MTIKEILSTLSGLILLYAFYPYIRAILRQETSPRKATWLIWSSCDTIILFGMLSKGAVSGMLIGAVIGATTTFILSLKFGESEWKKRDKICVVIAGLAIALWKYFGDSNIGIGLSCSALLIAAWPTYMSAWERPENEDRRAWVFFVISTIFGVLAIPHMRFVDAAPPIVFAIVDFPMIYLIFIRPYYRRRTVKSLA